MRDTISCLHIQQQLITEHTHGKINKAYTTLGLIKRNSKYLTMSSFVLAYKNLLRSQLCVDTVQEVLHRRVQKMATTLLLKTTRIRNDQLEARTLQTAQLTGKYNMEAVPNLAAAVPSITRGSLLLRICVS